MYLRFKELILYAKVGCFDFHKFSKLKRNRMGLRIAIIRESLVYILKSYHSSYFCVNMYSIIYETNRQKKKKNLRPKLLNFIEITSCS